MGSGFNVLGLGLRENGFFVSTIARDYLVMDDGGIKNGLWVLNFTETCVPGFMVL
jgi:hypothetical protein